MLLEKKYIPLSHYFQAATNSSIRLTFSEIEQIMGQNLPNAAYLNKSWWKKSKPPAKHFHAWMDAGYRVTEVEPDRYVVFEKADAKNTVADTDAEDKDILLIRTAEHGDARSLALLQKAVEAESDFMLYGKDERSLSTQRVRKQIIEWKQSGHSTIIIAILNGQHVGYLMVIGNEAKRASHRASLVLGLLKEAQGKGIAKSLLEKAEEWAKQKGISRLELTVLGANERARKLYEKTGFEAEGTRRRSLIIDGKEQDEIYLAKFLD
ncbi:GNAT family N-acetyltransferase [Planococcus citreus]|uniref:RimJ/RimL family protein N-acetyltransferase n=1 Tax=Planococcus citreus TaxID=1373 RepID=A0A497YFV5_9BACL|nr:GNAT family N-acetyltransferase [Planococcus citreus]RLJ86442.1 RimJ/RimL family protein N-acetyltransferase [Planococcus citreus]